MRIHILGICGTFMAGLAQLAKQAGHEVIGSDLNVYPPMSTLLGSQGIKLLNGYDPTDIDPEIDCVIVGNVIRRGNPAMEFVLNQNLPYISGPQWLAENILKNRWVLAVAGTHGKTTTSSLLTWVLEFAGMQPGFLIGGVPENFGVSARIGNDPYFVIEGDEYDSAFFDKRSKFIHYHPKTLILNNLEYDHADIFPNLDAIHQQFHYLLRTVPECGQIIQNANDSNLATVVAKGCWTPIMTFGRNNGFWQAKLLNPEGSHFVVIRDGMDVGEVNWNLLGNHNIENALAVLAAAEHIGIPLKSAIAAMASFKNVKRRLEIKGEKQGITIYDDFAHHPTAIATTLAALRAKVGKSRIVVVLEFGSYTMRTGVHRDKIKNALTDADIIICKRPETHDWNLDEVLKDCLQPTILQNSVNDLVENLAQQLKSGDHVVIMSNSGFDGIHQKLLNLLA